MEFIVNEIIPFIKNHLVLSLGWIALFCLIIYTTIKTKLSKIILVDNAQAIQMINKEDAVVVDLRSANRFKKGHVAGALNILPVDINNGSIKSIEKFKQSPVILMDENGVSTNTIGENLYKQGFMQVFILKDGILGWDGDNLPLVNK